jgi:hypothetical protein
VSGYQARPAAPGIAAPATAPANGVPFRAVSDYASNKPNILSFKKGDVILIVDRSRQDWWRGSLGGSVGAVPATYLRPMENEAPAATVATAASLGNAADDAAAERRVLSSVV